MSNGLKGQLVVCLLGVAAAAVSCRDKDSPTVHQTASSARNTAPGPSIIGGQDEDRNGSPNMDRPRLVLDDYLRKLAATNDHAQSSVHGTQPTRGFSFTLASDKGYKQIYIAAEEAPVEPDASRMLMVSGAGRREVNIGDGRAPRFLVQVWDLKKTPTTLDGQQYPSSRDAMIAQYEKGKDLAAKVPGVLPRPLHMVMFDDWGGMVTTFGGGKK
jgi:hypothetical protein